MKYKGIDWSGSKGEYTCRSARVFRSIVGTWAFVAKMGWRGKRGIAHVTGCRTMREAMSYASVKENKSNSSFIRSQRWHRVEAGTAFEELNILLDKCGIGTN